MEWSEDGLGAAAQLLRSALFLRLSKNPFQEFFARGLNVSLSTDDPLMLHMTADPLLEEYSVAAQVWKFSPRHPQPGTVSRAGKGVGSCL